MVQMNIRAPKSSQNKAQFIDNNTVNKNFTLVGNKNMLLFTQHYYISQFISFYLEVINFDFTFLQKKANHPKLKSLCSWQNLVSNE